VIVRVGFYDRYSGSKLARARQNFREDFRFSHDDKKRVDREIVKLLETAKDNNEREVTLPIKLVIALTLREGFDREGHRPRRSRLDQRKLESAIRNACLDAEVHFDGHVER
jgi:hypothetical protein